MLKTKIIQAIELEFIHPSLDKEEQDIISSLEALWDTIIELYSEEHNLNPVDIYVPECEEGSPGELVIKTMSNKGVHDIKFWEYIKTVLNESSKFDLVHIARRGGVIVRKKS